MNGTTSSLFTGISGPGPELVLVSDLCFSFLPLFLRTHTLTFECLITCVVLPIVAALIILLLWIPPRSPPGCELTEKIALWQFARLHARLSAAYCLAAVSSPALTSRRLGRPSALQNQRNPLILSPQTFSGWSRGIIAGTSHPAEAAFQRHWLRCLSGTEQLENTFAAEHLPA